MGKHERLLIADDSELNLNRLQRIVDIDGHEIAGRAHSVGEVKALVDDPDFNCSLAIFDGQMPNEGDGEQAFNYIRSKRPSIKVISLSTDLQKWGDIKIKKGTGIQAILDAIRKS